MRESFLGRKVLIYGYGISGKGARSALLASGAEVMVIADDEIRGQGLGGRGQADKEQGVRDNANHKEEPVGASIYRAQRHDEKIGRDESRPYGHLSLNSSEIPHSSFIIPHSIPSKIPHSSLRTPHLQSISVADFDLIVTSPSIPLSHEIYRLAKIHGVEIYGEAELGARLFDGYLIGVTGTNGKTTVTRLIGEILNRAGMQPIVCGNIGVSFAEITIDYTRGREITIDYTRGRGTLCNSTRGRGTLCNSCIASASEITQSSPPPCVIELSSFQLESIVTLKPDIALITNITPDHLDRHGDFKSYAAAKLNIAKSQTADDTLILSADDIPVDILEGFCPASKVLYTSVRCRVHGCYLSDGIIYYLGESVLKRSQIRLQGEHNVANCLFAVCAAKLRGVPNHIIAETLAEFEPDAHRLKFVGNFGGKNYYNDSKGTNIGASLAAARAMDGATALILGGKDKGYEFDELFEQLPATVTHIVALGETTGKICSAARRTGFGNIQTAPSLEDAVKVASATSAQNVLLSPACSSFDMFSDYEERGRVFEEIVNQLISGM
ncbi:MAG: UDP-N-acetylmuramoyl-L-alanine--D-glutamate ligase [Firmicutes bacterium]|nr:UDP-N-acetylmuramoyl-L-alanine--D-glutamate ligase [Bacillota bacterium]